MQKEKPSFEVIPNWRRYSRPIPVKSRIDPRYEFAVNQISLPAASSIETTTVRAACIDRIAEPSTAKWSLVTN
jgi:hypothetical protein